MPLTKVKNLQNANSDRRLFNVQLMSEATTKRNGRPRGKKTIVTGCRPSDQASYSGRFTGLLGCVVSATNSAVCAWQCSWPGELRSQCGGARRVSFGAA
jgi:hypothetical protein